MRIRTQGRSPAEFAWKAALIALAIFAAFNLRLSSADNAPQTPPFAQDWTNAGLITTDDNWTGVPGISGYRGDDLASAGADPQTVLADDALAVLDVNANQTNPSSYTTGGVAEFAIANPVVALNGSGTADAPYLLITLNITAQQNVRVQYNVRDLDGSADSSVQPLALHYRVGSSGAFTNVPGAFIADATTGPSLATLVTPVDVVLPAAADNQPLMQLRIMTTNAAGNDEWIGIDDIVVSGTPIAGDQAPSVTSTTPAANASNVAITSNITVNFSEAVNLGAGAVTVQCPAGTPVATNVAAANLSQLVLDPASDLPAGTTCSVLIESTLVADTDANDPPNELAADVTFSFSTVAPVVTCTSSFTPIFSIQGSGASAAITGTVTTKGVVVGDHEGPAPALRGFYLQDLAGDGIAETSDGLFVFNANNNSVAPGDVVYVTGTAGEFQDQTQISTVTGILDCGDGSVAATPVTFPVPDTSPPYLERFEGMLVQLTQTLYVTELFQLGRFGQVTVSVGDRLAQPTNVVAPGAPAIALQALDNRSRIILDDVLNNQNPDPIQFGRAMTPLSAANTLRGGDTVTGFTGVLNYTWGGNAASPNAYRVRPVDGLQANVPNFVPANPRPASAPVVGGNLKVASFNVLNYFLTLDVGTQPTCGPVGSKQECRGAETAEELSRQQRKLTEALYALDADIVGLIEIENSQDAGGNEVDALAQIVADLNLRYGVATYAYVDTGIVGTDTIRVGYIYKPARATPVAGGLFVDGAAVHNRPPVSQLFEAASGGKFNVVVNHFKSKSCSGVITGSPDDDQSDGQGCFNAARIAQSNALVAFINGTVVPTTGDADVLIIGDLNAYAMEQPVSIIKAAGYTNLIAQFGGPKAYSYAFDGQWGYLDHALASASLLPQVTGAADYHINADEPSVLDYNTNFKSAGQVASLFSPDEFRTSDHDPVVVGLSLTREPARICLNLGNDASQYLPDTDSFTFQGTAGDFVRIRVEQAAPIMQGRASLLVTGPFFLKLNMSAIPNEVSGNIVRSGRHTIFFSELFGRDSFRGNYCLLVSSTGASQATLQGTPLAE